MSVMFLRRGEGPGQHRWEKFRLVNGRKGPRVGAVYSVWTVDYPDDGPQAGFWYTRVK